MYAIKQPSLRINQADLKCKNGCGFYGNADWKGYCSKCYRSQMELERLQKKKSQFAENACGSKNDQLHQPHQSKMSGFTKFEEKKRQQTDKKSSRYLKNLHGLLKSSTTSTTKDNVGKLEKLSTDSEIIRHYQHQIYKSDDHGKLVREFLSKYGYFSENLKKDFFDCTQSFIKRILNDILFKPIEELAETAQKYYNLYNSRVNNHTIYQNLPAPIKIEFEDFYEKFCMISLYDFLFCPTFTNDEEKDLSIQDRIRKLTWVNARHLDCCINETSVELRDLVYTAITDLINVDSMKAPQDKLQCAVKCCRGVVDILKHCQGGPVSADDFLPALIFVVLKANPVRLKSNILYVTRFCKESKLMQGEAGYYFTNLCCAVSFIENITAESLNMPENEFVAFMSGEMKTVSAWESALVACEGMHQLYEHISILKTLEEKNSSIQQQQIELNREIKSFQEEIKEQVTQLLERTPLLIKEKKRQQQQQERQKHPNEISTRNYLEPVPYNVRIRNEATAVPDVLPLAADELLKVNYEDIDYFVENEENSFNEDTFFGLSKKSLKEDGGVTINDQLKIMENEFQIPLPLNSVQEDSGATSLIDRYGDSDEPEQKLVSNEMKPKYTGFSKQGCKIPNIPCNTGDNLN